MRIKIFLIVVCLLCPLVAFAGKTVRDGSGNLVETWTKTWG